MLDISLYVILAGAVCVATLCFIRKSSVRKALTAAVVLCCAGFLVWYFYVAYFRDTVVILLNLAVTFITLLMVYTFVMQIVTYRRQKRRMRRRQAIERYVFKKEIVTAEVLGEAMPDKAPAVLHMEAAQPAGLPVEDVPQPAGLHVEDVPQPAGLPVEAAAQPAGLPVEDVPQPDGLPVEEEAQPAGLHVEDVLPDIDAADTEGGENAENAEESEPAAEPVSFRAKEIEKLLRVLRALADGRDDAGDGLAAYRSDMDALRMLVFESEDYHAAIEKVFEIVGAGYGLPKAEWRRMAAVLRLLRDHCRHGLNVSSVLGAAREASDGDCRTAAEKMYEMPENEYEMPENELRRVEIVLRLLERKCE